MNRDRDDECDRHADRVDRPTTRLTFESVPTEACIIQAFADATGQDIDDVEPVYKEIDLPAIRHLVTNNPEMTVTVPLRGTVVVVSGTMVAVYPEMRAAPEVSV